MLIFEGYGGLFSGLNFFVCVVILWGFEKNKVYRYRVAGIGSWKFMGGGRGVGYGRGFYILIIYFIGYGLKLSGYEG